MACPARSWVLSRKPTVRGFVTTTNEHHGKEQRVAAACSTARPRNPPLVGDVALPYPRQNGAVREHWTYGISLSRLHGLGRGRAPSVFSAHITGRGTRRRGRRPGHGIQGRRRGYRGGSDWGRPHARCRSVGRLTIPWRHTSSEWYVHYRTRANRISMVCAGSVRLATTAWRSARKSNRASSAALKWCGTGFVGIGPRFWWTAPRAGRVSPCPTVCRCPGACYSSSTPPSPELSTLLFGTFSILVWGGCSVPPSLGQQGTSAPGRNVAQHKRAIKSTSTVLDSLLARGRNRELNQRIQEGFCPWCVRQWAETCSWVQRRRGGDSFNDDELLRACYPVDWK